MTARVRPAAAVVAAALGWLALPCACFRTAPIHYYTLASSKAPPERPRREAVRYTVHVAQASVPETLDRPEVVLRISPTQVGIDDGYRWAEPLQAGIARVVADDLARELDGALVSTSEESPGRPDVEVMLDVRHLDVRTGEGAAIDLDLEWTARWANKGPTRTGRSVVHAPSAPRGGYDAAVAACAAALEAASRDIAQSVHSEHVSRR